MEARDNEKWQQAMLEELSVIEKKWHVRVCKTTKGTSSNRVEMGM